MVGPTMRCGLELRLAGKIISRPYIDLTLWLMNKFGAEAEWSDIDTITVKPKPYVPRPWVIENDWSAASYWYEMVALNSNRDDRLALEGLADGSIQGDSSRLEYDFVNSPDMVQTFVVACAALGIRFRFTGLQTLRIKETDRIAALKAEMGKLGYVLRDLGDNELAWDGSRCDPQPEAAIDTYDDHRMALAFAPLALLYPGLRINNPQVVTKSYPHFWDDLRRAGFAIDERQ